MSRLHTDPVEVRRHDDEPAQFLWHGRLYVVREVLSRWTEAGGWWHSAAVGALATGDASEPSQGPPALLRTAPVPSSPAVARRTWAEPAPDVGACVGPAGLDDRECDWWRVDAAAGATAGSGVYDLCFDRSRSAWSLARVLD